MLHELWIEDEGRQTFCLAGPHGDDARALLDPGAHLAWRVEATSHFEAMTLLYEYMGWGRYTTDYPDRQADVHGARLGMSPLGEQG